MKHLKLFNQASEYEAYMEGENVVLPNVSYVKDGKIFYNPLNASAMPDYNFPVTFINETNDTLTEDYTESAKSLYQYLISTMGSRQKNYDMYVLNENEEISFGMSEWDLNERAYQYQPWEYNEWEGNVINEDAINIHVYGGNALITASGKVGVHFT